MDKHNFKVLDIEVNSSMNDVKQAAELIRDGDFNFEPALDSQGCIREISLVSGYRWAQPTGAELVEMFCDTIKRCSEDSKERRVVPMPLPIAAVRDILNAPRKLKKRWNKLGLFVSIRSRRGRHDARMLTQQRRRQSLHE